MKEARQAREAAQRQQNFYTSFDNDPFSSSSSSSNSRRGNRGGYSSSDEDVMLVQSGGGDGGGKFGGGGRRGNERKDLERRVMGKRTPNQEQVRMSKHLQLLTVCRLSLSHIVGCRTLASSPAYVAKRHVQTRHCCCCCCCCRWCGS
jgi:hypothetical protein